MDKNYGTQTPGGFLPGVPSTEDIFRLLGGDKAGGFAGLSDGPAGNQLENARKAASDELKRAYVRVFGSDDGRKVLEDLLDQTLRRGCCHPDGMNATIEQEVLYGRERKGNNSMTIYILKQVFEGRKLPPPGKTSAKRAKVK